MVTVRDEPSISHTKNTICSSPIVVRSCRIVDKKPEPKRMSIQPTIIPPKICYLCHTAV